VIKKSVSIGQVALKFGLSEQKVHLRPCHVSHSLQHKNYLDEVRLYRSY